MAETLVDIVQTKRSSRIEIYIVALVLAEVVLSTLQLLFDLEPMRRLVLSAFT